MVCAITSVRAEQIHFEQSKTINQIMQKAELEEKGFFVYFSARWCAPCQIMNRTTFQDQNLAEYIKENTIPVKMDIDTDYGKLWQDQFNVTAIPTLIFFDQWGNEVQRMTSGITGSRMLEVLQMNDQGYAQPVAASFFEEPAPAVISANYNIVNTATTTGISYVSNQFEIEVGNFFSESDVNNRIDELTHHFEKHRFYILQRKIPAGTIYQIVLAGFKSENAVADAQEVLIAQNYEPNIVRL